MHNKILFFSFWIFFSYLSITQIQNNIFLIIKLCISAILSYIFSDLIHKLILKSQHKKLCFKLSIYVVIIFIVLIFLSSGAWIIGLITDYQIQQ